ncbi:outer membrane lipoprotein chaperone LolA [Pseudidiomarina andamanensis]|uniref:Outer-membrane lipoprotein carrier protein n=1 Tax=Pseudidiomarina andamanensis TaxID=1940690 RepID=A0AA92ILC7_9GAMM|nr:outer membrane lipoprotein chaperone LolA [Pseudidiomarina andamanensis]MDS0218363.1 outer membrane lipoprotein chaperone LolA [Pseudidiomarina andamanensis]QGT95248.1 outer membrane lipoprotein carrier protein LolA [Pseudidiomarina andamanensis]
MNVFKKVSKVFVGSIAGTLLSAGLVFPAIGSEADRQALLTRLDGLTTLEADFSQEVTDVNGELVQQLHGHMALARPNLLHWQTDAPDETLMVADGQNLWYYNPFVEQVTVYAQADAVAQSPLLLLLNGDSQAWADYEVKAEANSYALQPLPSADSTQSLQLVFNEQGNAAQLQRIILDDGQGQISTIELDNVQLNRALSRDLFKFEVPEGIDVDDQR